MARQSRGKSLLVYGAGLLLVGGAIAAGLRLWQQQDAQLVASRAALAAVVAQGPPVEVATVAQGPKERLITLLGDTRPNQTATIYSKVGGYLKSIAVDRGDRVTAGQVVAVVDSAETDRQYDMAMSDLANKRKNAERAHDLAGHGWVSGQQTDQAEADYRVAKANVAQLEVMKSYQTLRAPFDGVVTARFVDVGALIQSSTNNQSSNQPVMTIADMSKLRIDVYVEQQDVPAIHVGDTADVADGTNSERRTTVKITRTSDQLDPRTRTLFVELEVDNTEGFLVPGSFAYVTLHVPIPSYPEIPVAGLVVRGTSTFVANIGTDSLVHLRPVKVASTDGSKVSLADGVRVGDRVVLNLPSEVSDGDRVQPVTVSR
jgi:membrane fusion protein, multidrug efflux system